MSGFNNPASACLLVVNNLSEIAAAGAAAQLAARANLGIGAIDVILPDNASKYLRAGRFTVADPYFYISTDQAAASCGIRFQPGSNIGTSTALSLEATTLAANFAGHVNTAAGKNFTAGSGGNFSFDSSSVIKAPSDGILALLNSAQSGFTRLQVGGTTNAFPAISRNGSIVDFVLADGSAYCAIGAGQVNLGAAGSQRNIITGAGSPEGVVTAGIGSIYLRNNGGAGTSFYVKESGAGNTGWVAK